MENGWRQSDDYGVSADLEEDVLSAFRETPAALATVGFLLVLKASREHDGVYNWLTSSSSDADLPENVHRSRAFLVNDTLNCWRGKTFRAP